MQVDFYECRPVLFLKAVHESHDWGEDVVEVIDKRLAELEHDHNGQRCVVCSKARDGLLDTVVENLPADVNLLLTLQCLLEAALYVEDPVLVAATAARLAPYEGRAVFNAGAVHFHGVTDDTLARAAALAGDVATSQRLRERALATYVRIGAPWWHDRLRRWQPPEAPVPARGRTYHLHPTSGGI